jgi:hypothetical protein
VPTDEFVWPPRSAFRLYDEDFVSILSIARGLCGGSQYVTKAAVLKAFNQYCRECGVSVKVETFLRKLRRYAAEGKYIEYTQRKGVYRVLV